MGNLDMLLALFVSSLANAFVTASPTSKLFNSWFSSSKVFCRFTVLYADPFVCSRTGLAPFGGIASRSGQSAGSSGTGGVLLVSREALCFVGAADTFTLFEELALEELAWAFGVDEPS